MIALTLSAEPFAVMEFAQTEFEAEFEAEFAQVEFGQPEAELVAVQLMKGAALLLLLQSLEELVQ
jgi:hypothetical protein